MLRIQTLGPFQIFRDDQRISDRDWKTQKNQSLVKILLTAGSAVSKERLME